MERLKLSQKTMTINKLTSELEEFVGAKVRSDADEHCSRNCHYKYK